MVQQGVIFFGIEGHYYRLTTMGSGGNKKLLPVGSPHRIGTKSPLSPNITSPTNIITMVSHLPLQQHEFNRSIEFDEGTLFGRGVG
jgi:hypothetical protein